MGAVALSGRRPVEYVGTSIVRSPRSLGHEARRTAVRFAGTAVTAVLLVPHTNYPFSSAVMHPYS